MPKPYKIPPKRIAKVTEYLRTDLALKDWHGCQAVYSVRSNAWQIRSTMGWYTPWIDEQRLTVALVAPVTFGAFCLELVLQATPPPTQHPPQQPLPPGPPRKPHETPEESIKASETLAIARNFDLLLRMMLMWIDHDHCLEPIRQPLEKALIEVSKNL